MTWVSTSKILSCFLFVIFFQGCWSRSQPSVNCTSLDCTINISCTVINLDYVDCNWTTAQMWEMNYTFSSVFQRQGSYQECSEYLQEHGHNVGCRIPLEDQAQRFNSIYTKLYMGSNQFISRNYTTLKERVKLNSPYNVSAKWNSKDELCLHWVNLVKKVSCVVNMVRYRRDADPWQSHTATGLSSHYCISHASKLAVYTFQVRSNMKEACGPSELWSDWSDPVHWRNYTASTEESQFQEWLQVFASVLGAIILIGLAVLLCYYERIRVVLLHVVPDPSKNLQNLFQKYNGNVESWVHVSRELKEAFDPDYTDAPCVVCDPNDTPEPPGRDGPAEQPSS
ncbi:interleukin 2 receptor, gamma b [Electrophorus electricus]|uniref:interleukin 2 receptor, gamma b n=1 Tax=Electrophorus electricus TaxID=8005 RepID=UPI0015D02438|nr:interleukin 2 receptor, gamma b [Electrophorus electricus]